LQVGILCFDSVGSIPLNEQVLVAKIKTTTSWKVSEQKQATTVSGAEDGDEVDVVAGHEGNPEEVKKGAPPVGGG